MSGTQRNTRYHNQGCKKGWKALSSLMITRFKSTAELCSFDICTELNIKSYCLGAVNERVWTQTILDPDPISRVQAEIYLSTCVGPRLSYMLIDGANLGLTVPNPLKIQTHLSHNIFSEYKLFKDVYFIIALTTNGQVYLNLQQYITLISESSISQFQNPSLNFKNHRIPTPWYASKSPICFLRYALF